MADDGDRGSDSVGEDDRDADWLPEVRSGYEEIADVYDDQRAPAAEAPIVERLDEALDPGSLVVDAGCGGGRVGLETLADRHAVVGIDIARSQLALARERVPSARLVQGELTRLPIATGAADALCSLHAVIHVPRERHDAVFAEFARVLAPGGELLVTLGTGAWEGRNPDWLGDADGTDAVTAPGDSTGAAMRWSFHGADRSRELLRAAGFALGEETVVGDELGGGEWLFLRARLPG